MERKRLSFFDLRLGDNIWVKEPLEQNPVPFEVIGLNLRKNTNGEELEISFRSYCSPYETHKQRIPCKSFDRSLWIDYRCKNFEFIIATNKNDAHGKVYYN